MELFFFHFLLSLIPFLFFIIIFLKHQKPTKPGFKFYPLVGALPGFIKNRHRFLDWSTDVLAACPTNTAVFRRPGKVHGVMTANPLNVEHMLKANFQNYPKGDRFISLLQDFLGAGIFNSDGDQWRTQRKTASYEFSTRSLRNFAMETANMELHTRLIPILRDAAEGDSVLDVQDILERFAFDNICKVAFNVDPGCLGGDGNKSGEFMQAFEDAATLSSGRFMYALPFFYRIKKFLNIGSERKLQKSIQIVHKFADEIILARIKHRARTDRSVGYSSELSGKTGEDLLSRIKHPAHTDSSVDYQPELSGKTGEDLLSRFMGTTEEYTPMYLRDIVISFILAGRDTTSSALTWFFWLLSSRPDVEHTILKDIKKVRLHKTGESSHYTLDDLREMHYLHAAISEAMRLYPPVPVDTKACLEDDVMPDGTFVGQGWFATYHTYAMGRMESIWGKDCCEYKPERWLAENGEYRPESPFRFPVFHGGPRMCLGKEMAYIQMKGIAASILERFEIEVLSEEKGKVPDFVLSLTLRMKGGLLVKVKERKDDELVC
ncbi:cytochrome P450 94B3 [Ipomoea triloba]|uniref:cytochrome P450 94B3 n=1 Tax=Ipomoea triloba TaxID=35885 RepID=UPI00125D8610|nr:cytochrome P450 94B3 [Ipomoea triloba]